MKTAFVTGGSGGIGSRICRRLAGDGYRVAVGYNSGKEAAEKLRAGMPGAFAVKCDVTDFCRLKGAYDLVMRNFGRLDLAVNCRGAAFSGLLQDMEPGEIDRIIDIDLRGTVYSCRIAAGIMAPAHSGQIINISSVWGVAGASCEAVYSACKGGVITLTKALAKELGPAGVRVNRVSPGVTDTRMMRGYSRREVRALAERTPLGRIGLPADTAAAVRFLAGEDSSFITGRNIVTDGGFIL